MADSVEAIFGELGKALVYLLTDHIQAGDLPINDYGVYSLEVTEKTNSRSAGARRTTRAGWDHEGQHDFVTERCIPLPEFSAAVESLIAHDGVEKEKSERLAERFCYVVSTQHIEKDGAVDIPLLVSDLIRHVHDAPIRWQTRLFIHGLEGPPNPIQLAKGIHIHRLTKEIVESVKWNSSRIERFERWGLSPGNALVEINIRERHINRVQPYADAVLTCLRLYGVGACFYSRAEFNASKFDPNSGITSMTDGHQTVAFKYELTEKDRVSSAEHFAALFPAVLARASQTSKEHPDHIGIALERYSSALRGPRTSQERIMLGITALEALLLKKDEEGGLSRRLAQRTASALRELGGNGPRIYSDILAAYTIRSHFVHGSADKVPANVNNLVQRVLEATRVLLCALLQLKSEEKEGLISKLDSALLSETAQTRLKSTLHKLTLTYRK